MACEDCDRLGVADRWYEPGGADDYRQGTSFEERASDLYMESLTVLLRKNRDYSPLNISQAPFGVLEGLLTRISDKYWRAVNLVEKGESADIQYESLKDTALDSANYWMIFALCLEGAWPGVGVGGKR